ncbi:aminodeoxychorismate lyase [Bacillus songklensis]|uniref:Aminodeoxychorismate lyase n=1 Tax=Bacillus songklensis TaxID=1069116 RepID=A0ABV8AYY5_9BACI
MYIYLNGNIIKREEAVISPFDHGYMYGIGLFETFRTYNGHPFLLDDHLVRLNKGLEDLNIQYRCEREGMISILKQLLKVNGLQEAYVRVNVSAGVGDVGLQVDPYNHPTVIVYVKPLPSLKQKEKEGILLETRRNSPEGSRRLKSHHYLNNILAKQEIGSNPSKEGIFLTKQGYIAEGIVSNVFFVKENIVYTPSLETGILDGVTRQLVLSLLEKLGVRAEEGLFTTEDLLESDEVFVTNSVQEITPITKIGSHLYPKGNHTLTYQLQTIYEQVCYSLWSKHDLKERNIGYDS